MPQCLKCGAELPVNEEGLAPVLCDRCAGRATSRARSSISTGTMRDYPVTTALIATNLAVFVGMLVTGGGLFGFSGQQLVKWGGNFGPLTIGGEYWRLVTAGFVHANPLHIAFNMWCLRSLGMLAEKLFGRWQTLCIYLLTGVGGAMLSTGYNPGRLEVGASGAVFGIAGALLAGIKFGNLSISAGEKKSIVSSMLFFIILNFTLGMGGNVDNMCHLGGFVTGLLIGLPLGAFAQHHKVFQLATLLITAGLLSFAGQELVQKNADSTESIRTRVNAALDRRDYSAAIPLLQKYTVVNPEDEAGFIMLGRMYEMTQQSEKAVAAYQQALKVNPNSADAKQLLEDLQGSSQPQK
ncbi:MAG TPA: rhomboid family intramembrane serine protease [Candidatus Angelobacter sp.]|nr:rhomboid family intramembrane serine protease [Candidatus Angelobacter sp.]